MGVKLIKYSTHHLHLRNSVVNYHLDGLLLMVIRPFSIKKAVAAAIISPAATVAGVAASVAASAAGVHWA